MSPLSPSQFNLSGSAPITERVIALDALRGLAVLGIFWINIQLFAMPGAALSNPLAFGGDGIVNLSLWTFGNIYLEGTMRGLFSIMFGAGIVLITTRMGTEEAPIRVADIYYRRTIWLIVFGIIHGYLLLMPNDILLLYGIAGLILFSFRNLSPRFLVAISMMLLVITTVLSAYAHLKDGEIRAVAAEIQARESTGGHISDVEKEALKEWEEQRSENWPSQDELNLQIATQRGSAEEIFLRNLSTIRQDSRTDDLLFELIDVWLMMFLGMALLKWRVITAEKSIRFYLCLMFAGYSIGLPLNAWQTWTMWQVNFSSDFYASLVMDDIGRVTVTLGHIGLFFAILNSGAVAWLIRALAAVGRIALTNYVSQTVIANLIFSGIGFGLFGQLDRLQVHLTMAVIWIFQIVFSLWWLSRFKFGPLEWGWRLLTYGKMQPMRLPSTP